MRFARHLNKILQKLVKKIGEIFFSKTTLLKNLKHRKPKGFVQKSVKKGVKK